MGYLDEKGYVSQIQSFSVNDGEGIRTTIFLSGCPLRCKWCCNPETWTINPKIAQLSVKEVLQRVKRDIIFFRESGGGITFSGGEATFQQSFLRALVNVHEEIGVDMAIETSGYFIWDQVKDVMEKLDFIFVDLKHMNSKKHHELTGVDNKLILENIEKIGNLNKAVVVRIPLVKGINDDEENISSTAKYVKQYVPGGKIEILPYHNLGEKKYETMRLDKFKNVFNTPSREEINAVKEIIRSTGVEIIDYK
jgi:glycyl-radical enzyme activating protein family